MSLSYIGEGGGGGAGLGISPEYLLKSSKFRLSVWMLKGWGTLIAVKLVSSKRVNIKVFSICLIYLKKPHIARSENILF